MYSSTSYKCAPYKPNFEVNTFAVELKKYVQINHNQHIKKYFHFLIGYVK